MTNDKYVDPVSFYDTSRVMIETSETRPKKDEWKKLQDNGTWDLMGLPSDRDVIPIKWVNRTTLELNGH